LDIAGDVRGIGGVAAIELVERSDRHDGYFASIGPRLHEAFLKRGLLLRPLGSILYFMPPYAITDQEVDWAFDQIAEVLSEAASG
jgi:adenosylmethionine-8-amino-7-oxononanoate aminotransferase